MFFVFVFVCLFFSADGSGGRGGGDRHRYPHSDGGHDSRSRPVLLLRRTIPAGETLNVIPHGTCV